VKKAGSDLCERIDNDFYEVWAGQWWQSESPLYVLVRSVNPARITYFKRKLFAECRVRPQGKSVLEVGCGGGQLCEEIARMGFHVTGIDPSARSLVIAADHAQAGGLTVNYDQGVGEALSYADASFDMVFCCDVLEHVRDLSQVVAEIARVLKPGGGYFCFDTINRTRLSRLVAIDICQEWKRWALAPPNLHIWRMFVKPTELKTLFSDNNLQWQESVGLMPNVSMLAMLALLRKRAKGTLGYKALGDKIQMKESKNQRIMYMGFAVKS